MNNITLLQPPVVSIQKNYELQINSVIEAVPDAEIGNARLEDKVQEPGAIEKDARMAHLSWGYNFQSDSLH